MWANASDWWSVVMQQAKWIRWNGFTDRCEFLCVKKVRRSAFEREWTRLQLWTSNSSSSSDNSNTTNNDATPVALAAAAAAHAATQAAAQAAATAAANAKTNTEPENTPYSSSYTNSNSSSKRSRTNAAAKAKATPTSKRPASPAGSESSDKKRRTSVFKELLAAKSKRITAHASADFVLGRRRLNDIGHR